MSDEMRKRIDSPCCAEFGTSGCRCWEMDICMQGSRPETYALIVKLSDFAEALLIDRDAARSDLAAMVLERDGLREELARVRAESFSRKGHAEALSDGMAAMTNELIKILGQEFSDPEQLYLLVRKLREERDLLVSSKSVVHECPPKGEGLMPCCGRTPFEVPRTDGMTTDPTLVNCDRMRHRDEHAAWKKEAHRYADERDALGQERDALRAQLARYEQNGNHCETCICGRRAPVQGSRNLNKGPGSIAWTEHLEAYGPYRNRHGSGQTAERLAERGGFSYGELIDLLGHEPKTWRPRTLNTE